MDEAIEPRELLLEAEPTDLALETSWTEMRALRLSCPFYLRDQAKHSKYKSCSGPGYKDIYRLKFVDVSDALSQLLTERREHLKKTHFAPEKTPLAPTTRSRQTKPREYDKIYPGMLTLAQHEAIRKVRRTSRNKTPSCCWREIYQIIFPEDEVPKPFNPDLEQFLLQAKYPSQSFLAKLKMKLAEDNAIHYHPRDMDAFIQAVLRAQSHIADLLRETGGELSQSNAGLDGNNVVLGIDGSHFIADSESQNEQSSTQSNTNFPDEVDPFFGITNLDESNTCGGW